MQKCASAFNLAQHLRVTFDWPFLFSSLHYAQCALHLIFIKEKKGYGCSIGWYEQLEYGMEKKKGNEKVVEALFKMDIREGENNGVYD